jgi:hypothetical protein
MILPCQANPAGERDARSPSERAHGSDFDEFAGMPSERKRPKTMSPGYPTDQATGFANPVMVRSCPVELLPGVVTCELA